MNTVPTFAPRLLAGFGTAALVAAVGLFASSRPAHTAGGPIPVMVSNAPLHVTDSEAARTPFQTQLALFVDVGAVLPIAYAYENNFTVPAGKRLVLQGLTARFNFSQNEHPVITLTTVAGGSSGFHEFTAPVSAATPLLGSTSNPNPPVLPEQPLTVYADAGSTVRVYVDNIPSHDFAGAATVTLTGYLVDAL